MRRLVCWSQVGIASSEDSQLAGDLHCNLRRRLRSYYFDTVLQAELEAGGRWRFVTEDRGRLLAAGEIVELEPPKRLVLTFAAADLEDAPSRLAIGLEAIDGAADVQVDSNADTA